MQELPLYDRFDEQITVGRKIQTRIVVELDDRAGKIIRVEHHDIAASAIIEYHAVALVGCGDLF